MNFENMQEIKKDKLELPAEDKEILDDLHSLSEAEEGSQENERKLLENIYDRVLSSNLELKNELVEYLHRVESNPNLSQKKDLKEMFVDNQFGRMKENLKSCRNKQDKIDLFIRSVKTFVEGKIRSRQE